jgi:hypothetical protein
MSDNKFLTSRDKNLTEKQRRGIDLVVKSAAKKYPFILGWELFPDWQKYDAHLYIDLYVDWNLISQYYNEPIRPFYAERPEMVLPKTSSLFSYLGSDYSWGNKSGQDEHFEKGYNHGRQLKNLFKTLYQALPEEYQLFYTYDVSLVSIPKTLCTLEVNDYIDIKEKK